MTIGDTRQTITVGCPDGVGGPAYRGKVTNEQQPAGESNAAPSLDESEALERGPRGARSLADLANLAGSTATPKAFDQFKGASASWSTSRMAAEAASRVFEPSPALRAMIERQDRLAERVRKSVEESNPKLEPLRSFTRAADEVAVDLQRGERQRSEALQAVGEAHRQEAEAQRRRDQLQAGLVDLMSEMVAGQQRLLLEQQRQDQAQIARADEQDKVASRRYWIETALIVMSIVVSVLLAVLLG